jgi:hypothetical protein
MIGNFNLPIAKGNAKTYIFTSTDLTSTFAGGFRSMQRWEKPKGINFVYTMLINAGTGGGGGFSFAAGNAGGGGGGGAPGNVIQFIQPAYLVPDVLYMTVARGGAGGAAATAGGYPLLSTGMWYTTVTSLSAATKMYYAFPSTTPAGTTSGRAGTVGAGGNGGQAYTLSSTSQQPGIMGFSNYVQSAALTGFAGTLVAGTNATFSGRPQGGAGGGGVTSGVAAAGGNVLGPTTSGQSIWNRNLSGGAATGAAGEDGITLFEPTLFSLPGAGGGANASGTGGAGGKGGIGCGGGGGGAGTTGGRGGDGGDGLVMLVCW